MKKLIALTLCICLTAIASGPVNTGSAEMIRFAGYGLFRGDSYGNDALPMDNDMSSYFFVGWLPRLNQHVSGNISLDIYSTSSNSIRLADLTLSLKLSENFTITAGKMKVPFGYAWTRSGGSMYFADRAHTNDASHFKNHAVRDNGAVLKADFDIVCVDLGLFNGTAGNNPADRDVNNRMVARATAAPADWLEMGVSWSSTGQPEKEEEGITTDSWSSSGIDVFAAARYPLGNGSRLLFEGEYAMLGWDAPVPEGNEETSGTCLSLAIGAEFPMGDGFIQAIRPMFRYDMVSPATSLAAGADALEDDSAALDFCLALDLTSGRNVLMLGGRSVSFENVDTDGYTNMYLGWRMNF